VLGGSALIALVIAALLGYSRVGSPPRATIHRLQSASTGLEHLRSETLVKELQQIPATVIDKGPLRHVPYLSYSGDDVEFNVYGDPDAPACLELGTSSGDASRRTACRHALRGLLASSLDRGILEKMTSGKQTVGGLTFEITPEAAPDAYGKWWVSVYDLKRLDSSRASETELKTIAGPRPTGGDAAKARPGSTIYVKGYYRKDGTYVPGYEKKAR
jgi:hypothetical protein